MMSGICGFVSGVIVSCAIMYVWGGRELSRMTKEFAVTNRRHQQAIDELDELVRKRRDVT
jgi:hypothetical protein